ncbi:MAG: nitrile hydratase accessory protein [Acidimicrobiia bacterium]
MRTVMREDTTEAGDIRRMLQALVCDLPRTPADEQMFSEPWELRAFAIAVAAFQSGQFQWSEFQQELIASIQEWESGDRTGAWRYYERWLDALESILAARGALTGETISERTQAVLTVPRNANHHHARREPVAVSPARA